MLLTHFSRIVRCTRLIVCAAASLILNGLFSGGARAASGPAVPVMELKVSVKDQKLALYYHGRPVRVYGVSTSKFGVGDDSRSYRTPIGKMTVADKIGGGQPAGMVFKGRRSTGEVLAANAPGRDPIVSRILRLSGAEAITGNVYDRCIYIHGTPEERNIGRPSSYGCIRMRSMDIIDLYSRITLGTQATVMAEALPPEARRLREFVWQPAPKPSRTPVKPAGAAGKALAGNAPFTGSIVPLSGARVLN